jgi:hypothetical protein
MFCSSSIWEHVLRGLGAGTLIACALYFGSEMPLPSLAMFGGALFLMRGCPMCWLVGLFETMANRFRKQTIVEEQQA